MSTPMPDDLSYKIIVIGDLGVGKSNMASRYCDDTFYEEVVPTIGVDFKYCFSKTLEKEARNVRLQVWDTSGQDRFVTLTTAFYRNCSGVVLCFDLTKRVSFENLTLWYERLKAHCIEMPPLILVGCKLDLVEIHDSCQGGIALGSRRQVESSEADAWARKYNCFCYIETSAKDNKNIAEVFQQLSTHLANKSSRTHPSGRRGVAGRAVPQETESKKKSGCCSSS